MSFYFCKLISHRPSFPQDITEQERNLMQEHVRYWTDLVDKKLALAFGPVADPQGAWGLALLQVGALSQAEDLTSNDPVARAQLGFHYEIYGMPNLVTPK